MKEIKLTRGLVALVDDEDFDSLSQYKWYANKGKKTGYYARRIDTSKCKRTLVSMHRLVMNVQTSDYVVDHKNHNTLDNQKSNLRICTSSQNMCNRTSAKGSSSKYLGVSKTTTVRGDKTYYYWKAEIRTKRKYLYLGLFKNETDAAKAYNDAAKKHYGEYANLNNI